MKTKNIMVLVFSTLLVFALMTGCGNASNGSNSEDVPARVELIIGAAASLMDVTQELAEAYEAANEHVTLTFAYASSGTLQVQIEEGAPMDVFMSAALAQMHDLEEQGLIHEESRNLLRNAITLIVPVDSVLEISGFEDVTDSAVRQIGLGDPDSVPGGTRAKEVFVSLGIADEALDKAVLAPDIRTVLTWVEMDEVDAGVVFMTDAIASDQIRVVEVADPALHAPSVNPVGIIERSHNIEEARRFMDFLFSDEARGIFERHGFMMY